MMDGTKEPVSAEGPGQGEGWLYYCPRCGRAFPTAGALKGICPCGAVPLEPSELRDMRESLFPLISRYLPIEWIALEGASFYFPVPEGVKLPAELVQKLSDEGFIPFIRRREGIRFCRLLKVGRRGKGQNVILHLVLLVLTIITTTLTGYFMSYDLYAMKLIKNIWGGAAGFSLGLLFILGSHELAHWVTARKNGIQASFPYFIPMIPVLSLGTLGAVINIRTPPPDREAMVKLGASGPLTGVLASVIVIAVGLSMSPLVDITGIKPPYISLGDPLLFHYLAYGFRAIPEGKDIMLHPLALAGWFALLINGFNLLPVGQLDGGHITRAFMPAKAHRILSFLVVAVLILLGLLYWKGWITLAVLALVFALAGNPGSIDDDRPPGRTGKILALAALLVFLVSVNIEPLKMVMPPQ
ncbi:MAG: site-2 protease family protein [Candidatus Eremiobacteraeota bacterium]|nr:site-2 protease family protein [Candidatus Eremiobacteraeota bacterium]